MSSNKNIIDLLKECDYSSSYKDYIIKILLELSCQKGVTFFKTIRSGNTSKTVGIKYPMTIKLKNNPFEISITIYIISDFPEKAPEIYIDTNNDPLLAVNPKNKDISPENFRVLTTKLMNWNKSISLQEILTEIMNSFQLNFPIYKKQNKPNVSGNNSSNTSFNNLSAAPNNFFNNNNNMPNNMNNFNNPNMNNYNNPSMNNFNNPNMNNFNNPPMNNFNNPNMNNNAGLYNPPVNNSSINSNFNFNNNLKNPVGNNITFVDNKKSSKIFFLTSSR